MHTQLFGVIPGPNISLAENLFEQSMPFIDGIELRLDYFEKIDLAQLKAFLKKCQLPVMFTLRRSDQGGAFSRTEEERLKLLEELCALQPAYVDLEYDVPLPFRKKLFETHPKILFVSSYHDFIGTPDDLHALYKKVKTPYAHLYKIVVTANSSIDALRLFSFVHSHPEKEKIIGISMGEEGKLTRILAPLVSSPLTFASLSENTASAPGQINAKELQEVYRFASLNPATAIYALIGDPVDKSLGALIHNAVFDQQKINAVYLKIGVKEELLTAFFSHVQNLPFHGFSVTMPHKETVLPFLTESSAQVQGIGACNTIHIHHKKWTGYNTDGIGALHAIEMRQKIAGKHIVFIGAGGAAKALIYEAVQRKAHVTVINRTPERALTIAQQMHCRGGGWELLPTVCTEGYDVIVNCIPDSELFDEKWILPEKIAMDIVYVPKNTPFLLKASRKKCRVIYGYEMFIGQALEQQRIWFPQVVDLKKASSLMEEKVLMTLA